MHILIVEDDLGMTVVYRKKLDRLLAALPNATVTVTRLLSEAKSLFQTASPQPNLVILDLTLPDSSWQNTLEESGFFSSRGAALLVITGQPVEKVRSYISNPDIEIVAKSEDLFVGNIFLELLAKVFNRSVEQQAKKDRENIRVLREILRDETDGRVTQPTPQ